MVFCEWIICHRFHLAPLKYLQGKNVKNKSALLWMVKCPNPGHLANEQSYFIVLELKRPFLHSGVHNQDTNCYNTSLLRAAGFRAGQETWATADISDQLGHITLEEPQPAPATSINYLPLMLKNVPFPSLLMKSFAVKVSWLQILHFQGGIFRQSQGLKSH